MAAPKAPQDPVSSALSYLLDKKKSSSVPQTEAQRVGKAMSDYDVDAENAHVSDSENAETGQRNINNAGKDARTMKSLMALKAAQRQAGDTPSPYKKGGMVKKASGGSIRGVGCAAKGKGKGTMY
jgi:hypothetical protein